MQFVSISSLQRTTKPMLENDTVCVLKNNEPVFFTLSPERMWELTQKELRLNKLESNGYTIDLIKDDE